MGNLGITNKIFVALIFFTFSTDLHSTSLDRAEYSADTNFSFETNSAAASNELMRFYGMTGDDVGFVVFDPQSGEILESQNLNELFIPASVTKALTLSAALDLYPATQRRGTEVYYDGRISGQVLWGNLYLKGGLQEDLDLRGLQSLSSRIRAFGIREIYGRIFYDDRALDGSSQISPIFGDNHSYNTGVSALNLDKGVLELLVSKVDNDWVVKNENLTPSVRIGFDFGMTAEDEESLWSWSDSLGGEWRINVSRLDPNKLEQKISLPLKNISQFVAESFSRVLSDVGIVAQAVQPRAVPARAQLIARVQGSSMKELAETTLFTSNNLFAELAGVLVAKKIYSHFSGDIHAAGKIVEDYWERLKNVPANQITLENSSGLTPYNWISPQAMKVALLSMWSQKLSDRSRFYELLHSVELDGVAEFKENCSKLWSKSGYLSYVRGLAGFFCSKNEGVKGFAVFINDKSSREILNSKGADPRFKDVEAGADAWAEKTAKLRSDLLRSWIARY